MLVKVFADTKENLNSKVECYKEQGLTLVNRIKVPDGYELHFHTNNKDLAYSMSGDTELYQQLSDGTTQRVYVRRDHDFFD